MPANIRVARPPPKLVSSLPAGYPLPTVLLFKRLFNFEKTTVAQMAEQRLNHRHAPGTAFPLQARLRLAGRDWPARVQNLSGNGVGLLLIDRDARAAAAQAGQVLLTLGEHRLEIDGRIAHAAPQDREFYLGVALSFGDFLLQKAYLQLLQPIAIGQSLKPVPAERVVQNEPQFIKQVFRGDEDSVLTVWLDKSFGTPLHSFEFQMHRYFCHADVKSGVLEAYLREAANSHKGKLSNPVFDISGGLHDEIRQLFRWVLPNLSTEVPDDVRAFLRRFAG